MKNGLNEDVNGKYWYLNGEFHREDGPAVEWANGDKAWYFKNKNHRLNGPAVMRANGVKAWWVDGIQYIGSSKYKKAVKDYKKINNLTNQ